VQNIVHPFYQLFTLNTHLMTLPIITNRLYTFFFIQINKILYYVNIYIDINLIYIYIYIYIYIKMLSYNIIFIFQSLKLLGTYKKLINMLNR